MQLIQKLYALLSSDQTRSVVIQIDYQQKYNALVLSQKRHMGKYVVIYNDIPIPDAEEIVLKLFTSAVNISGKPTPDKKKMFTYSPPLFGFVLPDSDTKVGADIMLASNWLGPKKAGFVLTRQIKNTDKDVWAESSEEWRKMIESDPLLKEYFKK